MDPVSVLLVDDSAPFLRTLTRFLQWHFPSELVIVGQAGVGEGALAEAQALQPQVILIALGMPGLPCLRIIPRPRSVLPNVRVIALTLFDTDGYRDAAIAAGADDLISKTRLATDLLPAIRRVMKSPPPNRGRAVGTDTLTIQ